MIFVDDHPVAGAQHLKFVRRHLSDDSNGQAGAGEGLAIDHFGGQTQGQPHVTHFVLEQVPQRLHQFEGHVLGQTADVVVGLDFG